jgi:tellurite resistance protein TerC
MDNIINQPLVLIIFSISVITMLVIDLGIFNKKAHIVTNKEATIWTIIWISLSMIFSLFVYSQTSLEKFSQFQSAYWIEKALSVDNLFVFILVFNYFNVPRETHHKVLFWGIIGAIIMRAIFIFTGVGLINVTYLPEMTIVGKAVNLNIILTLFGAFLIYAGIKSWFADDDDDGRHDDHDCGPHCCRHDDATSGSGSDGGRRGGGRSSGSTSGRSIVEQ